VRSDRFWPHPRASGKTIENLGFARSLCDCAEEILASILDGFSIKFQRTKEFSAFLESNLASGMVTKALMMHECWWREIWKDFYYRCSLCECFGFKKVRSFLVSEAGFTQLLDRVR
jgi:hypothetical protein